MQNDIPKYNLLAAFAAVMEHGSLSKAAEYLNTNQSTISTMLGRLKNEVQQELFIRSGRGVAPTNYSVNLYAQIQEPLQQLNNVFQSFGHFDAASSKRNFVVTAPEHLQWVLLDQFSQIPNKHLSLEIFDQPEYEENMYELLITQEYDAMIDILPPKDPSLDCQKLFDGDFVVVCSKTHPRIQGSLSEVQYMQEEHAVLERKRKRQYTISHYTNIDLSKRRVAYHGRSLFSNIIMCSQTHYLTAVPLSMALQFEERLQLQVFKPPFEFRSVSNYLIWPKKVSQDPAHAWLRNELITISAKIEHYIQKNFD
ncbi:LysR family transcriptional regulator [Agarivorans aestuarii]|uniref:LysR family transcriptional regulator n=1 Tax=Agarivorans aestuarii TaxID=1563703 RepID=A0ABU7G036_9ALTE|nr:LysR family transcriptional regulator [Agarivorans aestuarii]MEE1672620.1 LysR family transcriptional regulator [Agarivorans aestuarii]